MILMTMMKTPSKNNQHIMNSIAKLKVCKRKKRIKKVKKKVPGKRKFGKKINKDNIKAQIKLQGDFYPINIVSLVHKAIQKNFIRNF